MRSFCHNRVPFISGQWLAFVGTWCRAKMMSGHWTRSWSAKWKPFAIWSTHTSRLSTKLSVTLFPRQSCISLLMRYTVDCICQAAYVSLSSRQSANASKPGKGTLKVIVCLFYDTVDLCVLKADEVASLI